MWTWWVSLSSSAPVSRSEAKILVHSSNGRLEVTIVEPRSCRWLSVSKRSTSPGKRHVTEFIDDQQLDRRHLGLQPEQPALILGFHQLVDEAGGGREGDREAALAGRQAESQGDVGPAGTAVAERDDVLPRHDVFTAGQFEDQWLVQRRDGGEVEGLQAFDGENRAARIRRSTMRRSRSISSSSARRKR